MLQGEGRAEFLLCQAGLAGLCSIPQKLGFGTAWAEGTGIPAEPRDGGKWFILQDWLSAWILWCVNLPPAAATCSQQPQLLLKGSERGKWQWNCRMLSLKSFTLHFVFSLTSVPPFLGSFSAFPWNSSGKSSEQLFKGAIAS